MSALICATVLFLGLVFGDLKFRNNKPPGASSGLSENNILIKHSGILGFNSDFDVFRNFYRFAPESTLKMQNAGNSRKEEYAEGKSKGTDRIVIPFVFVLKILGMFVISSAAVSFLLLKGVFAAKIALIILGVIFTTKLRQFGTLMLLKNHQFYFGNGPSQYPTNEPNLSGFGYEYNFVPGLQTPEQKYSSLMGKGGNKVHSQHIK